MLNVINGGVHADNAIDLQEFMVVPAGASSFAEALRIGSETYHALKALLHERGLSTAVGDEGGFAPDLGSSEEAIEAILEAAERAGHGESVAIALDPAASEVFSDGAYRFEGKTLDGDGMVDFWRGLVDRYPIVSLEDALAEDDWEAWAELDPRARRARAARRRRPLRHEPGAPPARDRRGRRELDPRQGEPDRDADGDARGDLAGAVNTATPSVISHRSGETEDATIADLAVATNAGQIKTGAPARSDRVAKYNQLLRVEEELGARAVYPGWDAFPRAAR